MTDGSSLTSAGHRTVGALLKSACARGAGDVAIRELNGASLTYLELWEAANAVAQSLHARELSRRRVAIVLPNGLGMSLTLLGTCFAGIAVPFNPSSTHEELKRYFAAARVEAVITDATTCPDAVAVAGELKIPAVDSASLRNVANPSDPPQSSPDDLAIILLTSGTTGQGKYVPLTHRNLVAGTEAVARSLSLGPQDSVLSLWELHHIGGIVDLLLAPLASGGSVISGGGFDGERFFRALEDERPTWFQGVPTTMREILQIARTRAYRPGRYSLRFLRSVAAATPLSLQMDLEETFGIPVVTTFGMTEAAPLIASTPLLASDRKPGSVGRSCGPEICVFGPGHSKLSAGETGEIAIQGENVFSGYEGDPRDNETAFEDGWFLTGDVGYLDQDGDLFLVGRAKDMINRGGEKISPLEVEEVVQRHPDVADAACFPMPHETLGEEIAVAIVPAHGKTVSLRDLKRHVANHLAPFKIPRHLLILSDLPKTSVGKVRRKELAEQAARERKHSRENLYVAPENQLQEAIARLWADELERDRIGIDDDFAELGGDSLSSIRILLAVEKLTGTRIPDDAIDQLDTIRQMAGLLVLMGVREKPPFGARRSRISKDKLLESVSESMKVQGSIPDDAFARCETLVELETQRHSVETLATPETMLRVIHHEHTPQRRRWLLAGSATRKLERRRDEIRHSVTETVNAAISPADWRREQVTENADIFRLESDTAEKTLIVGFAGKFMRLMAPTYVFLCALDPKRHELLLLRDPSRLYFSGIPGIGGTLEAVSRWLSDWVSNRGYRSVVGLGTSAGGIPAICVSILNEWPRVLAVGSDQPSRHPHFSEVLSICGDRLNTRSATDVLLAYSGGKSRDVEAARQLSVQFPQAALLGDERYDEHALLYFLHQQGELRDFLAKRLLAGDG